MAKRKTLTATKIRNVIVVSDIHIGCCLALCHPDGAELDDGGLYKPSPLQLKVWSIWREFWDVWVPKATHGEPFAVIFNGDAIDGVHHNSTTQWSHNTKDQIRHAHKILAPVVAACGNRYYHIRGTEAHVGQSGKDEEALAKDLGAIPNEQGQHARYELWLRMDGGGLIHALHHVGTTSSAQHETSAINAELASIYNDCGRWGREPPDVVVRSHRHRCAEVRLPHHRGYAVSMVTACWQLKTPFTWKLAGARVTTPQIGASLIRQGDEELHTRHMVVDIGRSKVEGLRKLLRQLHADGRLRTARRLIKNIADGNQSIPVYSVTPVSKGRRK
jgi:hypothetical protein